MLEDGDGKCEDDSDGNVYGGGDYDKTAVLEDGVVKVMMMYKDEVIEHKREPTE